LIDYEWQIILVVTTRLLLLWNRERDREVALHGAAYFELLTKAKAADARTTVSIADKRRSSKITPTSSLGGVAVDKIEMRDVVLETNEEVFGEGVWGLGMAFAEKNVRACVRGRVYGRRLRRRKKHSFFLSTQYDVVRGAVVVHVLLLSSLLCACSRSRACSCPVLALGLICSFVVVLVLVCGCAATRWFRTTAS
jgi:hypothetical protein